MPAQTLVKSRDNAEIRKSMIARPGKVITAEIAAVNLLEPDRDLRLFVSAITEYAYQFILDFSCPLSCVPETFHNNAVFLVVHVSSMTIFISDFAYGNLSSQFCS